MRILLAAPLAALLLSSGARAQTPPQAPPAAPPPTNRGPVEMKPTGTPGKVEATRSMRVTATVYAVDPERRIVTLQNDLGGIETMKVGPEVKRLQDFRVGDTVVIDLDQGLVLEFQPAGTEFVPPTAVAVGERAGGGATQVGARAMGVQGTVTVVAINAKRRVVTLQSPGENLYKVKAGPGVKLDGLKVGDKLLATYVEAVAIKLERVKTK
jgi:hypothetical protein